MCCSERAAETEASSASVNEDIVGEESCIDNIVSDVIDHDPGTTDVESGDAAANHTETTSTQPTVDSATTAADLSSETVQPGDELPTDATDALVEDDSEKAADEVVQPDSDGVVDKPAWYFTDIKKQWRKFNIDLMPKVICGHLIVCHSVMCFSMLNFASLRLC